MTRIGTNLFLWALVFAHLPTALASTRYVNGVTGSDTDNCTSPVTACKTIGHAIAESAASDTIIVAAATYTENLTFGISLEVIGSGSGNTIIDGGGKASVIDISATGAHVTLSGVLLTHGTAAAGGGIYNVGTLTLVSSSVTGNHAHGTGGGIFNLGGTATITNSTVSSNSVSQGTVVAAGGGIANGGTMYINNSTISGNNAFALRSLSRYASAYGGGIYNTNGLWITNSTVSGNGASRGFAYYPAPEGGGIWNDGALFISSTTIAGNAAVLGSGIYGGGTLHNVIIANNSCSGAETSAGYNISSDASCRLGGPGDLGSTDPKLGTLGSYGGPTQTIPLLSGSPAIDSGDPNGCTDSKGHLLTTDQRGYPRPDKEDKGGCDRGAYESQSD
jgi:hypothetical protein